MLLLAVVGGAGRCLLWLVVGVLVPAAGRLPQNVGWLQAWKRFDELYLKRAFGGKPREVRARAPEFGGRNGFPPPMGCADTVPFQSKPNTPF